MDPRSSFSSSFFRPYVQATLHVYKLDPPKILEMGAVGSSMVRTEHGRKAADGSHSEEEAQQEVIMRGRSLVSSLTEGLAKTLKVCNPNILIARVKSKRYLTSPSDEVLIDALDNEEPYLTTTSEEVFNAVLDNQSRYPASPSQEVWNDRRHNERRYLTSPSTGVFNGGLDNQDNNFILYTDCVLVNSVSNTQYVVKKMLGQGSFGQVCRCSTSDSNREGVDVAVKIVKNSPAYYTQAQTEIGIAYHLMEFDPFDRHHFVRILDHFEFAGHICLVHELLSKSLYEVLQFNHHRGLSMRLVRWFTVQILEGLTALQDAGVIHCDLKPENILLEREIMREAIKLIDFGSSCMDDPKGGYRYTYIQSRHYRSPEVLLKMRYTCAMDMWSLGCIAAELFLGIPLFPGECEHDLLRLMIEILGCQPPDDMIRVHHSNKNNFRFFKLTSSAPQMVRDGGKTSAYQFLSNSEVAARERESQVAVREWERSKVGSRSYGPKKLADIILDYPIREEIGRRRTQEEILNEVDCRVSFADFLKGVLHFNPTERWTPRQALQHPFITEQPLLAPFKPPPDRIRTSKGQQGMVLDHNTHTGHWLAPSPQFVQGRTTHQPNPGYYAASPYTNGFHGSADSNGTYGDGHGFGSSSGRYVDAIGMGSNPRSYGDFPAPLSRLGPYGDGPGPGSSSGSYGESSSMFLYPNIAGTGVNGQNHGGLFGRDLIGFGGGFAGSPDIYHQGMNIANGQRHQMFPMSSNHQLVPLGVTPSHCHQPNPTFSYYPSPNSSTIPSPHSSFVPSPRHIPSPGSSFYLSPNSQLNSSPSSSVSHNSSGRFGLTSPYRLGGSAAQNISHHLGRQLQYGSQHPQHQWSNNQNPNTNGHESVIRGAVPHGASFPPRYRSAPGYSHFAPPASSSTTRGRSLGAMLRLPDIRYEEYMPSPDGGDFVPGNRAEQLVPDPGEASSSSNVTAMDVNEVSHRIARLGTRPN